jgi:hypothetical protein
MKNLEIDILGFGLREKRKVKGKEFRGFGDEGFRVLGF